jgi:GNAT superfamily N-acetyltransferase
MVPMQIIPAKTWSQQKAFLDFPWKIYKEDPYWIPQLRMEQSGLVGFKFLGHKDPFYERNEGQAFLAVEGKNVLGRICAIWNRGHIDRYNDGVGFLGFFDCIDDTDVARQLFDTAAEWLKQRECTVIRGPINPSLNHTLGLLIDGFNSSPMFMMTYNPPYYEKLFEDNGFKKSQDLYAYWGEIGMLPKIREKLLPKCELIKERTGATIRTANVKNFQRDVEQFLDVFNRSLTNTWGFVPMSLKEMKEMAFYMKFLLVPELAVAVELDGKMVGVSFALPDFNPRIKEIGGRIGPLKLFKLLRKKEQIKSIRVISTNVAPEYQMMGLGLLLLDGLVPKVMESGITNAEFSWVLESNSFSRGSLEKGGAIRTKTYRIYDRPIANPILQTEPCP